MKTLKTVVATLIAVAILMPALALGVLYSGAYDVAATNEHWPIIEWLLDNAVHRSVAERAAGIEVPPLDARAQLLAGAAHYEAMCAGCHAAPGEELALPGVAMYPEPPRLDEAATQLTPAQIFWVIKHGIQATGMPAWGASHSDGEMWSLVAFIQQLPEMDSAEYERLQRAADASGSGHHHGHGGEGHNGGDSGAHNDAEEHSRAEDVVAPQPSDPSAAHEQSPAAHGNGGHSHGADGHPHGR